MRAPASETERSRICLRQAGLPCGIADPFFFMTWHVSNPARRTTALARIPRGRLWHKAIGRIGRKTLLLSSNWFVRGGSTLLSMEPDIGSIHEALAKRRGVTEIDVKLDGSRRNSSQHQGSC